MPTTHSINTAIAVASVGIGSPIDAICATVLEKLTTFMKPKMRNSVMRRIRAANMEVSLHLSNGNSLMSSPPASCCDSCRAYSSKGCDAAYDQHGAHPSTPGERLQTGFIYAVNNLLCFAVADALLCVVFPAPDDHRSRTKLVRNNLNRRFIVN